MIATTEEEIKALRSAGKILAGVLADVEVLATDAVSTAELDLAAEHSIRARGAVPSFLNYQPDGASYPYPAALCVSINDEVVHGIPNEKRLLHGGDIVTVDAGLSYQGFFVDAARTFIVGDPTDTSYLGGEKSLVMQGLGDTKAHELINATRAALLAAIAAAQPGGHIGDIGAAVARIARAHKLGIVEELGGHAVGRAVHEKPFIPNDGRAGEGEEIKVGMVLAIEPMLAEGKGAVVLAEDEWTYRMADGKRAAHFEETILVTAKGPEILTR
ncbi:type I methionyl aminopeptidase [Candidatus Adlerbacteria bacterium RIFCSPLOWO2_01_FULL_54_21b]|uniref:Methionine aminopeptidase n=1 Tax=Candidatus Adlerbacteria bacterium RIFCSPLOWO2_01_FULL_54_21b TaxID=1797245 RepID=A0A1F4XYJ2_9BACT|nr:MAG: type I methionyl aminopeptidase [Candidatus Adlerbacteria bacterium RIFCSPLOWO2_01_FULL_54_21b]